MADLLEEARLAEGGGRIAEVVLEDVGVVDAGVERQGAGELHVPPGRDEHVVASADEGFHDELALADRPVVEQRPHEAVDRIAAEVLGDREDASVPLRGVDDRVAAADRQRQRLLAHRVQAEIEQRHADAVMRRRVGRAVGADQSLDLRATSARRR